jgi:D-sedoheptulose 7-phosphate isomerase
LTKRTDEIKAACSEIASNFSNLANLAETVDAAAELLVEAIKAGCKPILCGNGGSAADSQHLAAELMGRFLRDRDPLPALALTTDTSALTAIANDYGYERVFERQLAGIGRSGDVLICLSTSGTSANVCNAARYAKANGIKVIALVGSSGGELAELADLAIKVPATRSDRIQEMHIALGHLLCGFVEAECT